MGYAWFLPFVICIKEFNLKDPEKYGENIIDAYEL